MSEHHHGAQKGRWGSKVVAGPTTVNSSLARPPPQQLSSVGASLSTNTTVSDQAALEALLGSAAARDEARSRKNEKNHQHRHDSARKDSYNGGERRWHERERHGGRGLSGSPRRDGPDDFAARKRQRQAPEQKLADNATGPAKIENDEDERRRRPQQHNGAGECDDAPAPPKEKANFGLSGALSKDSKGGNIYKGFVLKFVEPPEARTPKTAWRFYVFDDDTQTDMLPVHAQSAFLWGTQTEIADIVLHSSCDAQHAVLQYRAVPRSSSSSSSDGQKHVQPYILDLESEHGTFLNGVRIDAARYYQLRKGDVLRFGTSKREYVLLHA